MEWFCSSCDAQTGKKPSTCVNTFVLNILGPAIGLKIFIGETLKSTIFNTLFSKPSHKIFVYFFVLGFLLIGCHASTNSQMDIVTTPTKTAVTPSKQTFTPTTKAENISDATPVTVIGQPKFSIEPSPTHPPSPTPTKRFTLMAVGDIMLGRTIGEMIESEGIEAPFYFTAEELNSADITLGNLECPISIRGEAEDKNYAFRAPLAAVESLTFGGFNVLNLANNHILDYGPQALIDTIENLAEGGIYSVGAGRNLTEAYAPVILEVNGLKVAFLGFMDVHPGKYDYPSWEARENQPGVAWAHEEMVIEAVSSAKRKADIVIVLMHNGYELIEQISSQQYNIARLAIDSGASLVIGSHPHILQRIDSYREGLIVYSMGNFVFDNFLYPPNYSAILSVELTPQGVESYELIDVIIQLNGVPQIMPYR